MKRKKITSLLFRCVLLSVVIFIILLFGNIIKYGELIEKYVDTEVYSVFSNRELLILNTDIVRQNLEKGDGEIYSFALKYHSDQFKDGLVLNISLYNEETNQLVQQWSENGKNLPEGGFREYIIDDKAKDENARYYIEIKSNMMNKVLFCSEQNSLLSDDMSINGKVQEGDLILKLSQKKYIIDTLIWGGIISFVISVTIIVALYYKIWNDLIKIIKCFTEKCKKNKNYYLMNIFYIFMCIGIGVILEKFVSVADFLEFNTIGAFNEYRFAFIVVVLLCFVITIRNRQDFAHKPEKIYLLLFFLIGMLFVIVMPSEAEISWDESIHYWKSVGVSYALSGQANIAEDWLYWHSGIGYTLPNSLETLRASQNMVQVMYDSGVKVAANTNILSQLNAIGYIPSAVGLFIGRLLKVPYSITFQLGAAMNMLLYIGVVDCAMKRLKSGKMILVVVSGIVTAMFLASVYSLDSWITGFTILGIAFFVGCMQSEKKVTNRELLVMIGAFTLAFMPKAIYFPLFILFFMIPKEKFISAKQCFYFRITNMAMCFVFMIEMVLLNLWLFFPLFAVSWMFIYVCAYFIQKLTLKQKIIVSCIGICIIGMISLFFAWKILPILLGQGDLRGGTTVNSAQQVRFILENPVEYARILLRYLKNVYLSFQEGLQVPFKTFGYIGESTLHVISFIFLWIITFLDKRESDSWKEYNKVKIIVIMIVGLIIILMATALYVSFTPVAYETINGCQPRYLIPLFAPFFLMIGSNKIKNEMSLAFFNGITICCTGIILLLSVWQVIIRCYI